MKVIRAAVGAMALALVIQSCAAVPLLESGATEDAESTRADWSMGATMPTPRSEMPAVAINGRIYIPGGFGGMRAFEIYDPAADEWESAAELPEPRHHLMAAALDGQLYVFGGARNLLWQPTDSAWAFDPSTGAWRDLAPMPEARLAGTAATVGEMIYIVGGTGGGEDVLAYSPDTDSWSRLPGPLEPREHVSAVALGGELWLLGGRWRGAGERRTVEVFSPSSATWRAGPSMATARGGFAAAAGRGLIVVGGGERLSGGRDVIEAVELWRSGADGWVTIADLPHPVHGMGAALVAGRWYVVGGSARAGGIDNAGRVQILTSP